MKDEWGGRDSPFILHPSSFPDPRKTRGDIVAIGEDLSLETLRDAYGHGIFPWPHDDLPLPWFCPRRRTVIFFGELHIPRSLRRSARQAKFHFTIDRAFERVIRACASTPRPDAQGTWISPEIIEAYTRLHRAGDAHSIEAWEDRELVGGLYGVDAGGVFTGESMFHTRPDASKLALLHIIDHLRARGATLFDCQVMTPHIRALGARDIPRAQFLDLLAEAQRRRLRLF